MYLENMKVVAFVKIVNTTPKELIAINVNRHSIDLMANIGMKQMCVDVSQFTVYSLSILISLIIKL